MLQLPEKQRVVAVGISKTSYGEVVELCRFWAQERKINPLSRARYICVTSVHGIIMAQDDAGVARYLNEADIATPDGMPVVWALRSFGHSKQQRVYGPTLMLEICRSAEVNGHRIFLYGGREDTLPVLFEKLIDRFPRLRIAGSYSPPFRALTEEEDLEICRSITDSGADIVFVGISTPKQEKWMYEHRSRFPGVTMIGVGAAFDFHAGRTKQAPSWMQRNGLEWLFRLSSEPARLWRRYLLITPRFIPLWARQRLLEIRRASSAM
jgi:N-acetylglucosaminyldiphosphoundecaprenol N-acetyl-beta-D-mannosaminyltransferase